MNYQFFCIYFCILTFLCYAQWHNDLMHKCTWHAQYTIITVIATQWQSKSLASYSVLRVTCRWFVKHWVVSYRSCISINQSISRLECTTPTGTRTVQRSNVALEWQWTSITYIVCSHHESNLAHHIALIYGLTWNNWCMPWIERMQPASQDTVFENHHSGWLTLPGAVSRRPMHDNAASSGIFH